MLRLVLCSLVVLISASVATAARSPHAAERVAITKALLTAKDLPSGTKLGAVRVSTLDSSYASAVLINARVGDADALLVKQLGKWSVRDVGTSSVGCKIVSDTLRTDLRLWGWQAAC